MCERVFSCLDRGKTGRGAFRAKAGSGSRFAGKDRAHLRQCRMDAGFDGAALIEVYAGDYGEYAELKQACDYLDELIYKIG